MCSTVFALKKVRFDLGSIIFVYLALQHILYQYIIKFIAPKAEILLLNNRTVSNLKKKKKNVREYS